MKVQISTADLFSGGFSVSSGVGIVVSAEAGTGSMLFFLLPVDDLLPNMMLVIDLDLLLLILSALIFLL
jgi:hypothetical protein